MVRDGHNSASVVRSAPWQHCLIWKKRLPTWSSLHWGYIVPPAGVSSTHLAYNGHPKPTRLDLCPFRKYSITSYEQTDKTQNFFALNHRSVSPLCMCLGGPRPVRSIGWQHRDFLSKRKYQYCHHTQADVGDCWPWRFICSKGSWKRILASLSRAAKRRGRHADRYPLTTRGWNRLIT